MRSAAFGYEVLSPKYHNLTGLAARLPAIIDTFDVQNVCNSLWGIAQLGNVSVAESEVAALGEAEAAIQGGAFDDLAACANVAVFCSGMWLDRACFFAFSSW